MKKLAFITTNYAWGGSEVMWSQTALRFSQAGFTTGASLKKWNPEPKAVNELINSGCHIYFQESNQSIAIRIFNRFLPASRHIQPQVDYSIFDQFKPDLVILSLGDQHEVGEWANSCRIRNIPYVMLIQLVRDVYQYYHPVVDRELVDAYTNARQCYFTCHNNISLMEKHLATSLTNAAILRNPYQVPYNTSVPYPSVDGRYKIAFPAALVAMHKGQDILLEVMRQKKWQDRPLEINIYGEGKDGYLLKKLLEIYQLTNVYFRGYSSKIEDIWKENHALLLASRMEGIPIVLVGAMFSGRMAIVTDVGGHKEVMEDNITGFIAKAPTSELLDEALELAWQQRENWEQMGQAAAEKIRGIFPADPVGVFVEQLKEFL